MRCSFQKSHSHSIHQHPANVVTAPKSNATTLCGSSGQIFTRSYQSTQAYANEGINQPFLYRTNDSLVIADNQLPYTYRPGRVPEAQPAVFDTIGHYTVYLRPLNGIDTLITVCVYATGPQCGLDLTAIDQDSNVYHTVRIGSHCWTRENLVTLHYAQDGSEVPDAAVYYADIYPDVAANLATYGRLYSWYSAVKVPENDDVTIHCADMRGNVQGFCPAGWHLPAQSEFEQLRLRIINKFKHRKMKKLFSTLMLFVLMLTSVTAQKINYQLVIRDNNLQLVTNRAVTANVVVKVGGISVYDTTINATTNAQGLLDIRFGNATFTSIDWSNATMSVQVVDDNNSTVYIPHAYLQVNAVPYACSSGNSVILPTNVSSFTNDAGYISGYTETQVLRISNDTIYLTGGSFVKLPAGFDGDYNRLTNKPNLFSGNYSDLAASLSAMQNQVAGSFTSSMTGLTANTTYYVRAYATNSAGTTYGNEISFTTASNQSFTCGTSTIKDHQGNVYNTVKIGSQCWTKENMRCTTLPSTGTTILETPPSSYSYSGKKAYYVNGDSSNTSTYGLLYNWCASVDTFNTSSGETSTSTEASNAPNVTFTGSRRGICPLGWHVSSDADWTQLTDYVSSQSQYQCGGNSSNIAKALSSTAGWNSNSTTCAVGNTPVTIMQQDFRLFRLASTAAATTISATARASGPPPSTAATTRTTGACTIMKQGCSAAISTIRTTALLSVAFAMIELKIENRKVGLRLWWRSPFLMRNVVRGM